MKLVVLLFLAAFCYQTVLAQDEEAPQVEGDIEESDADLEAELGDIAISETIVQLPTLPQDIDREQTWECIPRMIYRNSCQVCICSRNRQLKCKRLNCAPAF
ncbi:unnamed protein product [Chironomus riparius]|uniref:Uncharacterized protein n=1 Tax=Chironomus riparius TaxID=315576 RepID=A0A9N9RJ66_9DIPT|nr:unnamed protein product [Chironomus riparius]